jgi:hypothetical protein
MRSAMQGLGMRSALHLLAENFEDYAVPKNGRYVKDPAIGSDHRLPEALTFQLRKTHLHSEVVP